MTRSIRFKQIRAVFETLTINLREVTTKADLNLSPITLDSDL